MTNYSNAQLKAEELINKYTVSSYFTPVKEIAESEGLDVQVIDMPTDLEDVSGFLDIENKKIFVNAKDQQERQRFTIAHELGHYILHRNENFGILYRKAELNENDSKEKEANYFAANLLVPRKILEEIQREYKLSTNKVLDAQLLATLFGVSPKMMSYRMTNRY